MLVLPQTTQQQLLHLAALALVLTTQAHHLPLQGTQQVGTQQQLLHLAVLAYASNKPDCISSKNQIEESMYSITG
jgi:hemoglobin-like flavoprotein